MYTYINSCGYAYATFSITINPTPEVDTINGPASLCAGSAVTLDNSEAGGLWTSSSTAVATVGSASGILLGLAAGTTLISYSITNGCGTDFDTLTIRVLPLPAAIAGTASLCAGTIAVLTNTTSGGTWASSNTAIATVGTSGTVTGIAAGNATITYTLATGCFSTRSVTVYALPAAISGTTTVCLGAVTTLTDAGGGTWASSNTAIASVGSATGIVSAVAAGTATISYTLGTGCRTTTVVTVSAAPSLASATNNGPVCAGATLTLTANTPLNVTGYLWSGPVAITASTSAVASVATTSAAAGGTYSVTVSNGSGAGCSRTYTTTATVNALPTAAPANNSPICTGGTVTLSANPGGSTNTYTWSGASLSSTTAQNPTATPSVTSTYSLTVRYGTGIAGCSPTTVYTTTVTVASLPTASPANNGPVCSAATVTLSANPGGSADTYTWSGPSLSATTSQNPTATPSVTSTYSLTVSYGSGRPGCSPVTVYTTSVTVRPAGYWLGATSTAWVTSANWCGGLPTTTTAVLIPSGATYNPVISSGTSPAGSLTILSGASLTVSGGTLQLSGAITNSGTLTATAGIIELNGSTAQTIPASTFAGNTVYGLTVNNAAGVTLGGALSVSGVVKATTGNLASAGNLTLLSSAARTALIDGSGAGEVTGNVTMQRYLDTAYGYRYISSPFTAATLGGLSAYISLTAAFPLFYSYNENLAYTGWTIDTVASSPLSPLTGYAANFGTSAAAQTIALTGVVSNHAVAATLYNHNNSITKGYNLVGNPYPSPIDWTATSGWTKTNIDNAVYYFDHGDTNQYYGTYSSYVSGISSNGVAGNIIPAMQGFFVHVSNGAYPVTATLGINNPARVTSLTPFYHKPTSGTGRPLLRLEAAYGSTGRKDAAVVYFDENATDTFDNSLEALKLLNTDDNVPNLYTSGTDDRDLSIKAIIYNGDTTSYVPLTLQVAAGGRVQLTAGAIEHMPAGTHVYLVDAVAGIVQDLQQQSDYSVQVGSGKTKQRFFIAFSTRDHITIPPYNGNLNAYTSGNELFVYLTLGDGVLEITDVSGRRVMQQQLSGTGYHKVVCPFAPGIYLATLYSASGRQTKKIFIGR